MAIWLGEAGGIRLSRKSDNRVFGHVGVADVDVSARRLGLDHLVNSFYTGSLIWIRRVGEDGRPSANALEFVDPSGWPDDTQHNDGRWYVHNDGLSVRLYREWSEALEGGYDKAVHLLPPSAGFRISVELSDDDDECIAQVTSWELNTNRSIVDITPLGEEFQRQMGTTISGSGSIECLFDSRWRGCDDSYEQTSKDESALYLHQLALRQQIGSTFSGLFLLKRSGTLPITAVIGKSERERELFYRCDCVISQVAVALVPDEPIISKINFVTTGVIQLLYDYPVRYLLKEQGIGDKVLLENGGGILLDLF